MKQVNFRIPLRILFLMMGLFLSIGVNAQITVQGHVKDATGEPVIGATIQVVGTSVGTATDFDGNFELTCAQGAKLQVSSIGYQTQTVAAAPSLIVVLEEDSQVLENVVVIGYGTVRKNDLTGSVTALKPDTKNKGVVVSAQDMLGGKIAGVNVTSGGGTPGGGATIRIRGGSSLNASNDPLIVIDGVPMDNNGVKGLANGLSLVNPQDIESFNVLKDASATAIYGSRGSNGVIIITTKKGRKGQSGIKVSYNGSLTISTKKKTIDVMDGDAYRQYVSDMFAGDDKYHQLVGYYQAGDGTIIPNTVENGRIVRATGAEGEYHPGILGEANTNWQNEIYRTAISHDHNLTLAGSIGTILPYRLSLGYTNQQGILKTSDFQRYTVALNLNPSFFEDHLSLNLNAKYMYAKSRYADGGAIGNSVRMDPTQPINASRVQTFYAGTAYERNLDIYGMTGGYFEWFADNSARGDDNWPYVKNTNAPYNPVAILDLKDDRAKSHSFVGNADIDYKIHGFEDLRLHLTLGGDFSGGKQTTEVANTSNLANYFGSYGWDEVTKENLTLSAYAQYFKDFNEDHHFDIMAGYEWQHFWRKQMNNYWGLYPGNSTLGAYRYFDGEGAEQIAYRSVNRDIPDGYEFLYNMAGREYNNTWLNDGRGYRTENYLVSFFGRANYILKDRYLLTFTLRDDGSSRFRKHWSLFPSAALAWKIYEEPWFSKNGPFSDLKLRLGWGKTGQQEGIGDYTYFANYYMSNGVQGAFYDLVDDQGNVIANGYMARPNAYNPDLKWETTTTTNVGLDFGFMQQRLTGSIDWYYRKTTDLINYASIPAGSNFRNMVNQNIGSLKNTGIELALSWKAIQNDDWFWTIDYNFTYNKNKITELLNADPDYFVATGGISSGTGVNAQAHKVGYPASSFYVYQQVYDTNGKPIEGQVVDRDGDGQITDADKYMYKSPMAPVTMGLSSRLEYKNWDLGFSLRASIGNYVFNDVMDGYHNVSQEGLWGSVSGNYLNNRPIASTQLGWQTYDIPATLSDYWVQNGSFLKCDNITLGYSFNNLFRGSSYEGVSGRVYATASNVFTITKYKGLDPEVFGGIDNNIYPRPFSFILGLSLNF